MTSETQPTGERRYTRRDLLRGAGAVAIATVSSTGLATAAPNRPPAETPADHVGHITEARADLDELRDYAPRLVTTRPARDDLQGMYGWTAESEDYDVTAHYYWVRYHTQRSILYYFGIDANFGDSHSKDHEPIIQFVNPDGTVDTTVYSGGHHYAADMDGEFGQYVQDRVTGIQTHPKLRTVRPWNHYAEATLDEHATDVENYRPFESWLDKRDTWYRNGRFESTAVEAIEDPFSFYDGGSDDHRTMWWAEGTRDAFFGKHVWNRLVAHDELRYEE